MKRIVLLTCGLLLIGPPNFTQAQDTAQDTIRLRTSVVFIDVLVKDKRTGQPITDLTRDNFEVFDNGRPRLLSYFSRENDKSDRPLALLLILAPMDDGARKSLQRPEVARSMATALANLPPEDEVAVMMLWRDGSSQMLTNLTRDRAKVAAVLAALPKPVKGKTSIRPPSIIQDVAFSTVSQRPASQVAVVVVTDSVFLMSHAERDTLVSRLLQANVSFNSLVTGTDPFFKLFYPLLKPAENDLKASWYDVPQFLAKQTGGDYVRVRKAKEYGQGLEKLIGDLAARYSLGFALDEDEPDDGQMHRLEVKVKARAPGGKERNLEVSARQGYYLPKVKKQSDAN